MFSLRSKFGDYERRDFRYPFKAIERPLTVMFIN